MNELTNLNGTEGENLERELAHIRDALRGLRFGAVTIIVQDGVVVQIDRTEKRRFRRSSDAPASRLSPRER